MFFYVNRDNVRFFVVFFQAGSGTFLLDNAVMVEALIRLMLVEAMLMIVVDVVVAGVVEVIPVDGLCLLTITLGG